ncbi:MAG: FAD-dependent oxidoreductase [Oscillospiraceae bacterium]|jgi:2,4-dienoyl-CoA reductase-like NADH-dependent reductase (Old Yellow Enzyme family)/thioredoxin reductase|nr:FAD-dependent oxidoreductase [Oscillospiraceae bacterium]
MKEFYTPKFPHLVSPLRIGKLTLRSRMASAPMGFPDITEDGCITRDMTAFYEHRAKGGASIVTVSEGVVHWATGKSHARLINMQNPGVLASLTNTARAIRRHGAAASIELNHGGMYADMDVLEAERGGEKFKYGPSDMTLPDGTRVRKMPRELIAEVVDSFGKAAALARRAGFDMVMIHGAHGWLLGQFLSPALNRRTDKYGGSLENRARLSIEVIGAVRAAVGADFPIEFRMSGGARDAQKCGTADAVGFAKLIEGKIDLLHVSCGFGEDDFSSTHPPMFVPHGVNVHLAAAIRASVSVPVATVGALNDPAQMEDIIASGKADIVCMARALLADPELPKKVANNREDEIIRCLRCFTCHAERMLTQTRVCSLNPVIGREYEARFEVVRSGATKRVLVAGGGPGGLTAALTAARRGHAVTLCEASGALGGAITAEEGIDFKRESLEYIRTMERLLLRSGVNIRLHARVTPELVREFCPDALIVAVGAEPVIPEIPGIDGRSVIIANDMPRRRAEITGRVAVIGGGLVGCESAVYLAREGYAVTIIEAEGELARDANPRHRPMLLELLRENAKILVNTRAEEIGETVIITKTGESIPADTVIIAVGQRPRFAAAEALRNIIPETAFVGDCVAARTIREATFRGYHAALDL